jgi:short-subunit dehydrogenase
MIMNTTSQTALITGASSGIGYELAKLFAKDHYNLVLVARSQERLMQISQELKELGSGNVTVISKDLSLPNGAAEVYKETKDKGITVNILVNDAGAGEYGSFLETDLNKELSIIQLNISSLVILTKLFMADMLALKEGKILQLASIASYQPTPKLAVYAATKAFILSFSDAIGLDLKDSGITVTALIPDATATDFFRKAGMEHTKAATDHPENPEVVAKIGYKALMNGDPHAYAPGVRTAVMQSVVMPNRKVAEKTEDQMKEDGQVSQ